MVKRVAKHIERVVIVDPMPGSSRLLAELMKEMGSREVRVFSHGARALEHLDRV